MALCERLSNWRIFYLIVAKLTNRQRRFIDEYLISWNASDAARRAGYTGEAAKIGSRLLTYVDIQIAIHERLEESAMKADENLKRIADQSRLNLTDFVIEKTKDLFDKEGNVIGSVQVFELNWEELKKRGHLIKSITNTQWGPRIEAYDGQAALFKIGTALGALTERVDLTTKGDKIDVVFYIPSNERDVSASDNNPDNSSETD